MLAGMVLRMTPQPSELHETRAAMNCFGDDELREVEHILLHIFYHALPVSPRFLLKPSEALSKARSDSASTLLSARSGEPISMGQLVMCTFAPRHF